MILNTPESIKQKLKVGSYNPIEPVPTALKITKEMYDKIFIDRYFVYRVTNNTVYEVLQDNYDLIVDVIFKKVKIKWKLSGPANSIYNNNVLQMPGVIEYNTKQIKIGSKTVPQLEDYLKDPLQYYIGY